MAEEHRRRRNWNLQGGQYLGEISSLSFLNIPSHLSSIPYLLAGSGSQILLYDLNSGKLIRSFQVFEGIRVHGITCSSSFVRLGLSADQYTYKLVVFGEKRVKIFALTIELASSSEEILVNLKPVDSLPRLSNWVLDARFLQDFVDGLLDEECKLLAIGCSDNSIHVWDTKVSRMFLEVQSQERSLLYSMRLWGDSVQTLRVASGTIYNEIIVWRAAPLDGDKSDHWHYGAVHMLRLRGHEGSIFRIVWSLDGSRLVSVSDDRSARIWEVDSMQNDSDNWQGVVGPMLFGHRARVWDCCISDLLVVTAGEDCTCRVWGLDGKQLQIIKEHIGRGIWRCLYEPNSSLLVTAGFDSAIKVHQLLHCGPGSFADKMGEKESTDDGELFRLCLPNSLEHTGLMDSKSEYVRCLRFTHEDALYVATNNGYLYHAKLSNPGNVKWSKLVCIVEEGPIICMDLLPGRVIDESGALDDWVALGDGKGNMTIVRVIGDTCNPVVSLRQTWKAGPERQLLGTFWCKSLGHRYVFSANPRGLLKLWRLTNPLASASDDAAGSCDFTLLAEFSSCFGMRIICLDALVEDEVLACGDLRGNLVLFPLSKDMLAGTSATSEPKVSSLNYFKGAHGISTVSSLSVARLTSNKVEICSTGGDGCICYFEYDRDRRTLEFVGLKQVKELSLIQSVCQDAHFANTCPNNEYAAGFASTDFILWNLTTETKIAQISCGGWRRPHSFYLGDVPELKNCFAYVKDDVIHIHRHWTGEKEVKIFPQNLHMQFHGREIHSLCFISGGTQPGSHVEEQRLLSDQSSWIATGCEDGTVRLTSYASEVQNWSTSELLGEHVGGSAVRSVCCVSTSHIVSVIANVADTSGEESAAGESESPCLLISVGAKRVLTSWLLRNCRSIGEEESSVSENGHNMTSRGVSLMTFQWLATDMPAKSSRTRVKIEKSEQVQGVEEDTNGNIMKSGSDFHQDTEKYEDDWRYMAVTAFLVKYAGSRLTICFIAVACSDATLTLRAFVLPHRLWFDVASLVGLTSPVLSLQHAVVPLQFKKKGDTPTRNTYLVIGGATDGSIAFWDVTKSVEAFVKQLSCFDVETFIDCQKRPRTGRGSQGGRKWKLLGTKINTVDKAAVNDPSLCSELMNSVAHKGHKNISVGSPPEMGEIEPMRLVKEAHQSGVNCLHVCHSGSSKNNGNGLLFNVISGGDDQALHCLRFDIVSSANEPETKEKPIHVGQNQISSYELRLSDNGGITSAHSSAVKGVWTDGNWVFSTGLDQRIRCWFLNSEGKLEEHSHIIISVPEPEALDARAYGRGRYQIAVAGRGMQMVEFST